VRRVKHFRHAPLAFWTLVLVAALGVSLLATRQDAPEPVQYFSTRTDLVAAYRAKTADLTLQVQAGLASMEWIDEWAKDASAFAERAEGESSKAMTAAWREARAAALEVGELTELDSQAAVRAIKRVNDAADALAASASGIPVQTIP
jgi:hypothetical protein